MHGIGDVGVVEFMIDGLYDQGAVDSGLGHLFEQCGGRGNVLELGGRGLFGAGVGELAGGGFGGCGPDVEVGIDYFGSGHGCGR